jgi:hypothetical protein
MPSACLGWRKASAPLGIRVVVADDPIAVRLGAAARLVEARDLEGHVVDAGAALGQEAVEEAIRAFRLQHLEPPATGEAPLAEPVGF